MARNARRRRCTAALVAACAVAACDGRLVTGPAAASELHLGTGDRILVLAPHPDDEVLCCGGVLRRAVERGLPVRVVFLTHGDSNQWSFLFYRKRPTLTPRQARAMGEVRRSEAIEAAQRLGVSREHLVFLGYPDHAGLRLLVNAWGDRPAVRGPLTRARAVPYPGARRPGAPHTGEEVLADLQAVLREFRPTRIFVSHPADHHPDHAALYLFARIALWELPGGSAASLHPFLIHYPRWSPPTGNDPERPLAPPADLDRTASWQTFPLSVAEVGAKRRALEAHRTQFGYSARRLLRFVRANELFGDFPALAPGARGATVADDEAGPEEAMVAPELLPSEVLAEFVDLERLRLRVDGGVLEVSLELDRALRGAQTVSVYLLAQRDDRPFAAMPKVEVRIGAGAFRTLERGRRLAASPVTLERRGTELRVAVPLALLDRPGRVLLSARTASRSVAFDRIPWRIVEVSGAPL